MSSIWLRSRSSSLPSSSAISGSISARPAVRSCSSVSCATAMPGMVRLSPAVRAARGPRPRERRLREGSLGSRPGEVDHRRRRAGKLAAVDEDGLPRGSPRGTSSSRRGSGPPWRFALVAATAPTRVTIRRAAPRSSGTRTPIVSSGRQEREASLRVREDQRQPAGQEAAHDRVRQLGHELEEDVDLRGEERDRLIRPAALQPGQRLGRERCRAEAVHRVRRQDDRPALADRLDGLLNEALFRRPLAHVPRDLSAIVTSS